MKFQSYLFLVALLTALFASTMIHAIVRDPSFITLTVETVENLNPFTLAFRHPLFFAMKAHAALSAFTRDVLAKYMRTASSASAAARNAYDEVARLKESIMLDFKAKRETVNEKLVLLQNQLESVRVQAGDKYSELTEQLSDLKDLLKDSLEKRVAPRTEDEVMAQKLMQSIQDELLSLCINEYKLKDSASYSDLAMFYLVGLFDRYISFVVYILEIFVRKGWCMSLFAFCAAAVASYIASRLGLAFLRVFLYVVKLPFRFVFAVLRYVYRLVMSFFTKEEVKFEYEKPSEDQLKEECAVVDDVVVEETTNKARPTTNSRRRFVEEQMIMSGVTSSAVLKEDGEDEVECVQLYANKGDLFKEQEQDQEDEEHSDMPDFQSAGTAPFVASSAAMAVAAMALLF